MIHVFFLHSSITALVSREVVKALPPGDKVWVISARGDWSGFIDSDRTYTEAESVLGHPSLMSVPRRMRAFPDFRNSEVEIERFFQSERYRLYVPHTHNRPRQLIATHALCDGFSYIEEGLACYRSDTELKSFERILAPVWGSRDICGKLSKRCLGNKYFSGKAQTTFAVSPLAFKHLGVTKEIVKFSVQPSPQVISKYSKTAVLALPYLSNSRRLPDAAQDNLLAINRVAELLKNSPYRKVFVRPHPSEKGGAIESVLEEISVQLPDRVEIDHASILSEEICSVPDVTLISCGSSLSWYAKLLGAKTLSYANIMCELSPAFGGLWKASLAGMEIDPEGTDIREEIWASC